MLRKLIVIMAVLMIGVAIGPAHPLGGARQLQAAPLLASGVQVARPLPNAAGLGYYEYLPQGYGTGARYPLIVFFHGLGERGNGNTELDFVLRHGPPKLINNGKDFPAIVISPQLPAQQGGWWTVISTPFVDYLLSHYDVDLNRIYVTGLSLGGGGAWMYAKTHPDQVAALVPICGPDSNSGYQVLAGMPIWSFHQVADSIVPYAQTTEKLTVITGVDPELSRPTDNQAPGYTGAFDGTDWVWRLGQAEPPATENPILTAYEDMSHDAWTKAYDNQALWDWLFRQQRGQSSQPVYLPLLRK